MEIIGVLAARRSVLESELSTVSCGEKMREGGEEGKRGTGVARRGGRGAPGGFI